MAKKGKKYLEAAKLIEKGKLYSAEEAVALVKKTATTKFDEGIDVVFNLNLDTRHADQQLRGAVVLPHGTGKSKTVWVLAEGAKAEEAKAAGADNVGAEEVLDAISKGELNFDVLIATPDQMAKLGRYGRVLGPKGLMPNPKTGTVTMDLKKAVDEIKKGKVTYRTDKQGNINCAIGKVSFTPEQIAENFQALYDVILKARPAAVKGTYMKNVVISSSMAPSIKVDHAI